MAKVKIQGHASGTGVLTVTAPNTSTDRTITLPDADVTLGAATPSIDDNGNATAITIDSNENVGIGITSPLDILHLNDPDDDCVINLDTAQANKNSIVKFSDPDAQGRGMIQYNHTTDSLRTTVAGTERTRIHSDGVLTVPAGIALGVAATSNASSNTLDDYEEGTWTPAFTFDSGTFSGSYAINAGIYTKVGRIVHASFTFNTSSVNLSGIDSGTAVRVGGLPFTSDSTTGNASSTSTLRTQNWNSNANSPVIGYMDGNTNFIRLMRYNGSTGYNTDYKCVSADLRTSGDSNQLTGTITYQAS